MRQKFASELYELMKMDSNIYLITADLGYIMFDRIRDAFPARFFNVQAAEQAMLDIAVGFALNGKIPVVYSITPFLLFRPFESIRNYVNKENIPVVLVGSGRDHDYEHDGFSHDGSDDEIIKCFENIEFIKSDDFDLKDILYKGKPVYLNLKR